MPHRAALAALTSQEAIKTNSVVLGGMLIAAAPVSMGPPDVDSIIRFIVLFATCVYSVAKAIDAATQAAKTLGVTKAKKSKRKRKRSVAKRVTDAAAKFRKALEK